MNDVNRIVFKNYVRYRKTIDMFRFAITLVSSLPLLYGLFFIAYYFVFKYVSNEVMYIPLLEVILLCVSVYCIVESALYDYESYLSIIMENPQISVELIDAAIAPYSNGDRVVFGYEFINERLSSDYQIVMDIPTIYYREFVPSSKELENIAISKIEEVFCYDIKWKLYKLISWRTEE